MGIHQPDDPSDQRNIILITNKNKRGVLYASFVFTKPANTGFVTFILHFIPVNDLLISTEYVGGQMFYPLKIMLFKRKMSSFMSRACAGLMVMMTACMSSNAQEQS